MLFLAVPMRIALVAEPRDEYLVLSHLFTETSKPSRAMSVTRISSAISDQNMTRNRVDRQLPGSRKKKGAN